MRKWLDSLSLSPAWQLTVTLVVVIVCIPISPLVFVLWLFYELLREVIAAVHDNLFPKQKRWQRDWYM